MKPVFLLLRPLLLLAFLVGMGKLFWTVLAGPAVLVKLHSLTFVAFLGALILTFKVANRPALGVRHLWLANIVLFGFCQLMVLAGMAYSWASGRPTLYHDSNNLAAGLGFDPGMSAHVLLHLLHWVVLAPTIVTWISGAPIIYLRRRHSDSPR